MKQAITHINKETGENATSMYKKTLAKHLNVGHLTVYRWIQKAKKHGGRFETPKIIVILSQFIKHGNSNDREIV